MAKKASVIDILWPMCTIVVGLDIVQLVTFVISGRAGLGTRLATWGLLGWTSPGESLGRRLFMDMAILIVIVGYKLRNKDDDPGMTNLIIFLLCLIVIVDLVPKILLGVGRLLP